MKRITLFIAVIALFGCATPEMTLQRGYKIVEGSAKTANVLLDRHAISSDEAARVHAIGSTGQASLDAGKKALEACRAAGGTKCSGAVANINLGSGVLQELETYLESMQ